ncbi:MAG: NepR family anti-sigma factor [Pannonibacter sp.]
MRERTSQNGTEPLQETATEAAQQITDRLRQLYESVQAEGIPDKFLDLLERLDEAEQRSLKK